MKQLNTLPIEHFLTKSRIALKSNQKHLTLDIKDVQALSDSLSIVMTRLAGAMDAQLNAIQNNPTSISIKMDGGGFN